VRDPRKDGPDDPPRHLCPQVEFAPCTSTGQRVLDTVRKGGCFRTGWGGFEGIDTSEALRRLGPDIDAELAVELLQHAETGIRAGLAERDERKEKDQDG